MRFKFLSSKVFIYLMVSLFSLIFCYNASADPGSLVSQGSSQAVGCVNASGNVNFNKIVENFVTIRKILFTSMIILGVSSGISLILQLISLCLGH